MADTEKITIIDVKPLNGRSLQLQFSNGQTRLFDVRRLRGPQYIPLADYDKFVDVCVRDGDLYWPQTDLSAAADLIYNKSVDYDPNYKPIEYVPTKRDILGERIAMIVFPLMVIAAVIGLVHWYMNI
ncbi:MAG: DUF2442 domain-containing protein [Bacillota bacterium]|nr:DUF2442 domain-containing protein [Bacillota bacterium]